MKRPLALALMMTLIAALTTGCASKYGTQKTTVTYYPACYRPIADLRESEHSVAKSTAVGAGVGALGGALIGLLATGKASGALTGAAVGAAAGGVAGNIYGQKQKIADDNRRLASYLEDIDGDISKLDVESAAAKIALQCYDGQFDALIADIKGKRLSRREAEIRYGEIRSGREEAIDLLGGIAEKARALDVEYQNALVREEQALSPTAQKKNRKTVAAVRQRKQSLARLASATDRARQDAQTNNDVQGQKLREAINSIDDARV